MSALLAHLICRTRERQFRSRWASTLLLLLLRSTVVDAQCAWLTRAYGAGARWRRRPRVVWVELACCCCCWWCSHSASFSPLPKRSVRWRGMLRVRVCVLAENEEKLLKLVQVADGVNEWLSARVEYVFLEHKCKCKWKQSEVESGDDSFSSSSSCVVVKRVSEWVRGPE